MSDLLDRPAITLLLSRILELAGIPMAQVMEKDYSGFAMMLETEVLRQLKPQLEAARKYANPDMEAFHKALYEWYHSERPMSSDVEQELVDAALSVTEKNELRAPGPIRELSEILDDITEDE